jgi:hypothetical protein
VSTHFLRGGLFENMVVNEFIKEAYSRCEEPDLSFWRDSTGNEVDLIRTVGSVQHAYEIKSGSTFSLDFFKGIGRWAKLSGAVAEYCATIYTGDSNMKTALGNVVRWQDINLNI